MSDQYLFFKEHQGLSLFDESSPLDASLHHQHLKLKLLAVSNTYGFVVVGFNNVIKMLSTAELDSDSQSISPRWVKELDAEWQIVSVLLNCSETSLFVLAINKSDSGGAPVLHVFDLEYQTPVLMNTIKLRDEAAQSTTSIVLDLCPSPSEPDQISVCYSSGLIQILSGVSDKKTRVVSKQAEAFCVCWSPKGKNLAVCSRSSRLLIFNTDLELKFNYECLTSGLTPKSMSWLAKKQFIVFYEGENESPVVHSHEIITDKNAAPKDTFYTNTDVGDLYAQESSPYHSSFYISNEPNWNLILLAYSKSPDLSVVKKHTTSELLGFELIDIEDYRCSLPLTRADDEQFPLGFGVSLNTKRPIEFGTFGQQPASPLVLFLTNMGNLETFYMINLQSKDRSICVEAKQMKYKQAQPQQQQQPQMAKPATQQNLQAQQFGAPASSSASMFNFANNQFGSTPQQQTSLPVAQQKSAGPQPSFSFNMGQQQLQQQQQPALASQSAFGFKPQQQQQQQQPQTLPQPQFNLTQQQQQQQPPQQKILQTPPSQPPMATAANLQFSTPTNQLKTQILAQQSSAQNPITPINKQHQAMMQQQQQVKQTQQPQNNVARVREFNQEVEDFKATVAKLFSGKDLSKQLLNLSIIKETKKLEETFNKLVNEMKTISEECSSLRTTLLADFHNFEKLRLIKFDIVEQEKKPKSNMSMLQKSSQVPLDIDPFTRKKLDNVKYLFAYLQRELPNIKSFIDANRRRKPDSHQVISLDGIYDTLRRIELECQQSQKRIQNLYAQIKFLRLDRNILDDFDHHQPQSKSSESQSVTVADRSRLSDLTNNGNKSMSGGGSGAHNVSMLSRQMNTLELNDEETERAIKVGMEKSNRFYVQLFDVLNKRKQVPMTNANFEKLSLYDEKYGGHNKNTGMLSGGGADASIIGMQNINEASFLNFKTSATPTTPNVVLNNLNQQLLNGANTSTPSIQKPLFQQQPQQQQQQVPSLLNQGSQQQQNASASFMQQTPLGQQSTTSGLFPQGIKPTESTVIATQGKQAAQPSVTPQIGSATIQQVVKPVQSSQQQQQQQPLPAVSSSAQSTQQAPTSQLAFHLAKPPLVAPSGPASTSTTNPAATLTTSISGLAAPSTSSQLPTSTSSTTFSFNLSSSTSASGNLFGGKPPLVPQQQQQPQAQPSSKSMFSFSQSAAPTTSSTTELKPSEKSEEKAPQSTTTTTTTTSSTPATFSFNTDSSKSTIGASTFSFGGNKTVEQTKPPTTSGSTSTEKPVESTSTEKEQPQAPATPAKPSVTSLFGAPPAGDNNSKAPFSFGTPASGGSKPFSFGMPASTSTSSFSSLPSLSGAISTNDIKETKEAAAATATATAPSSSVVEKDKEVKAEEAKPTLPDSSSEKKPTETTSVTTTTAAADSTSKPAAQPVEAKVDVKPATTAPSFSFGTTSSTPSAASGGLFFGKPATTTTGPDAGVAPSGSSTGTSLFSSFLKDSKPSTTSTFGGTQPPVNPFSSIVGASTAAAAAKPANEVDADMDSSGNGGAAGGAAASAGISFGGLSFGTKPATALNEPPKNVFGAAAAAAAPNANPFTAIASQPKSPFGVNSGGGLLKTPTFGAAAMPGGAALSPSQPAQPTSLFGAAASTASPSSGGNLFTSFKSTAPAGGAKPMGFGAPPAFGAAPAFGATPAFGAQGGFGSAPSFGAAPAFGSTAPSTGGGLFGSATPSTPAPTFGSGGGLFGQAAPSNQPNAFASLASSGAAPSFGSGFGQNTQQQQPTFGALAQQTPTQPLFSSFGGGSNTGGFGNPTSPSFTAYRK